MILLPNATPATPVLTNPLPVLPLLLTLPVLPVLSPRVAMPTVGVGGSAGSTLAMGEDRGPRGCSGVLESSRLRP